MNIIVTNTITQLSIVTKVKNYFIFWTRSIQINNLNNKYREAYYNTLAYPITIIKYS